MRDLIMELLQPEHLLLYLFAYGLSAIPTSYLVAKLIHRVNLKEESAARHTATYVYHTMSKWSGLLVFSCDLMKGLLPCAIGLSLPVPVEAVAMVGFFSVLGHCFSIWLKFSGGHGSVTAAGCMLVIYWPAGLALLAAHFLLIQLALNAGLSSLIALIIGLLVVFFGLANKVVSLIVAAMLVLILLRHRSSF